MLSQASVRALKQVIGWLYTAQLVVSFSTLPEVCYLFLACEHVKLCVYLFLTARKFGLCFGLAQSLTRSHQVYWLAMQLDLPALKALCEHYAVNRFT